MSSHIPVDGHQRAHETGVVPSAIFGQSAPVEQQRMPISWRGGYTMAVQHYSVEVQSDFLEKITRARPAPALAELIWNALDADASRVSVTFHDNEMGGLDRIIIRDNGDGIPRDKAPGYFGSLGGSWKKAGGATLSGRTLHGEEGRGRFKAFALGAIADWKVVYERDGRLWSYVISMSATHIQTVDISDEEEAEHDAVKGVTLEIGHPIKNFALDSDTVVDELTTIFALYLSDYQSVVVEVAGRRIDPSSLIVERKGYQLQNIVMEDQTYLAKLEIIQWNGINARALYLCNDKRFPLSLVSEGRRFHVGGFQFTAYLQSSLFTEMQKKGTMDLAEMQKPVIQALDEAQQKIKDHFVDRAAQEASSFVQEWKDEQIYPYQGEPANHVEKVERQVFDIVALNVARHMPDFSQAPIQNKQFQLRMLRQAIEKSPQELQTILNEVLDLPKRKQDELASLLQNVSLSSIISSAKVVADRLKFLMGLDAILFDKGPKQRIKERSQLHRILAENCWLFGEEFSLSVDDQSLTEVLRAHKKLLKDKIAIDKPVKHPTQKKGIVDLMLSKVTRHHREDVKHLVVELKRPSVKIGSKEVSQIEQYAFAVAADDRFKAVDVTWEFWVISDDYDRFAEQRITDPATGEIFRKGNTSIFVKTWAQVLNDNRARMQFFQEHLQFEASKEEAIKHLQERHAQYLEGVFPDVDEDEDDEPVLEPALSEDE